MIFEVCMKQLFPVTGLDKLDLSLKWNAKAKIEFDLICDLINKKVFAEVTNKWTFFGEHMAFEKNFTQTVKGLFTARFRWLLSFVVFDA